MSIGDIWRLTVKLVVNSNAQQNVLHYKTVTEAEAGKDDLSELALIAFEVLGPAYTQVISEGARIEEIQIRGVTTPVLGLDVIIDELGIRPGAALPFQVAAVISLKTGLIGRSFRGRIYVPTTSENDNSGGQWNVNYLSDLGTFSAAIREVTPVTASSYEAALVVYSRKLLEGTPVTAMAPDPVSGTQRSRRIGAGI